MFVEKKTNINNNIFHFPLQPLRSTILMHFPSESDRTSENRMNYKRDKSKISRFRESFVLM